MPKKLRCSVCAWEQKNDKKVDGSQSPEAWADKLEVHRTTITRHLGHVEAAAAIALEASLPADESGVKPNGERFQIKRGSAVTMKDWREWIALDGDDPDDFTPSIRSIAYGVGIYSNRLGATPKRGASHTRAPEWPVVQPAAPVAIAPAPAVATAPRVAGLKLALKCADHQIGFRALPDGRFDPFHDDKAMALFIEVCRLYRPDKIQVLGDFLDLPSQSRWAQEAAFARTTQMALDRAHRWLAELRAACPDAEIIIIEGNHDKRMQNFMELNALAAFGLKRAELPDSWPVMSIPNLLRLDDLNVRYIDAYPAATDWDNGTTRNIHGTKANSKGSTTSQYVQELPHVNTWAGHTHRPEITYSSVLGAYGKPIESYSANPGCMCRTDGAAPSVHGAIGADGIPVPVVENWQAGFGVLYYNETESWPQVYRIKDGTTIIDGRLISV